MNNNQDSFSSNPQFNNQNNMLPNQPSVTKNMEQPLNVIPQSKNFNEQYNINNQVSNQSLNMNDYNSINNNQIQSNNNFTEENPLLNQKNNKFITQNIETQSTALNDLNVDGTYHNMGKYDYSQDPRVKANLEQNNLNQTAKQKNTITITSEGKIFIIIIIALLLFTIVMPYIFDFIRNIKY